MSSGLWLPVYFGPRYAVDNGVDPDLAFYSLSILAAGSFFGRVLPNRALYFYTCSLLTPRSRGGLHWRLQYRIGQLLRQRLAHLLLDLLQDDTVYHRLHGHLRLRASGSRVSHRRIELRLGDFRALSFLPCPLA